jgi:Tol biopolymer transport system component
VLFGSDARGFGGGDDEQPGGLIIKDIPNQSVRQIAVGAEYAEEIGGAWSPDGRQITFFSQDSVFDDDLNGEYDVFVVEAEAGGGLSSLSLAQDGAQGNGASLYPCWSPDGTKVAFVSWATNLVNGDTNMTADAFMVRLP